MDAIKKAVEVAAELTLLWFLSPSAMPAIAQTSSYQQRIAQLRLQSAYYQQQAALQTAVQQTTLLVQAAVRQQTALEPSGFFRPLDFHQQESAIRAALLQAASLQQVGSRFGSALGATNFSQTNALRTALRTTLSLQASSQIQNGLLTPEQIQSLFAEQTGLTPLLASPPPQMSAATRSR